MESRPRENSSEDAANEADLLWTQHNAGLNIVFAWGRRDHYPGIGGGTLEELGDESPHTGIPGRKACASTRSCQMAMALRPRPTASTISSR